MDTSGFTFSFKAILNHMQRRWGYVHTVTFSSVFTLKPQNRYQTRRDTSMCFGWRKTSEISLRAMTPSWSAHGALYLCFSMKNFRVHSRMASYDGVFSVSTRKISDKNKMSSEWHFWSCIYSVLKRMQTLSIYDRSCSLFNILEIYFPFGSCEQGVKTIKAEKKVLKTLENDARVHIT
jgi:hypothetical protein